MKYLLSSILTFNMKAKILFWLTVDITQFAVAHSLQKNSEFDLYAIIDTPYYPKKFFQEQKLVKFQKVWYLHDYIKKNHKPDTVYLSNFENKYNLNLWKLAINDRIFYRFYNFHRFTDNDILSIDEQCCKFFEHVLEEIKPIAFITKEPGFHHLEIFNHMCHKKGIKVMFPFIPKIADKVIITDSTSRINAKVGFEETEGMNRNFNQLRKFLEARDASSILKKFVKKFATSKKELIKAAFRYLVFSNNRSEQTLYAYYGRTKLRVLSYMIWSTLKRKYRKFYMNRNFEKNPALELPFVYFAIGTEPERYILIDAPFSTNQIEVIRHVAKSLPVEYKLYVKENPVQETRDWRSISDYKDILRLPNVRLIHPDYPAKKLLEKCSLAVAIAGSAGLEAAFYEKTSIVFADTVYSNLPSVFRVKSPEELPAIIRKALNTKVQASDLDRFVTFLERNSFDYPWVEMASKQLDYLFYGGQLLDIPIQEEKVKLFLEENLSVIDKISEEHLKKLRELC